MMVNVYKSWTGLEFDTFEFPAGTAVRDCVRGVDWNNAVILCNGNRVGEGYVLKENDVVAIRETPSSSFLIGTGIILAALGTAELVSYATTGKWLFANIRDWLTPNISSASNKEQSQNETLPSLKGARNQNISGKPVPFIVGQTRITPYKVGNGYHSISGTDGEVQRYHQLYVIGYNDIRVGMFKFGETDFAYNGMSESYGMNGYRLEIGNGTKDGSVTDFAEKTPFAKASPALSIATNGEVPGFKTKVTEEGIGKQIINANGSKLKFTRASDRYPRMIEVEIGFNGLMSYDDEGKEQPASAQISVGYSIDGGKSFSPFNGKHFVGVYEIVDVDDEDKAAGITGKLVKDTITRKKNRTMRFVSSHTFSYDEFKTIEEAGNGYAWIRVERADPDSTDSKTVNKAHLVYIRTWVYDKEKSEAAGRYVAQAPVMERLRDKTTRCGVSIDATENVSDELDEFNCMAVAECRTWNGDSGGWSEDRVPTDNPAANALNVMQSRMLGGFAYPDEKIDLAGFGRLHEFCKSMGFSVGTALTSRKKLSEVLDNILIQARAYRIVSGQRYSVFIDKSISVPACVLNNSNILKDDGATNSKEFNPLPDGFKIKFVNRNIGYDEDEVYVMFNEDVSYDDPAAVIESLEMPFVTDPKQVAKNAWFEYGKRKHRPELWKRTVTTEANLIEIGSRVDLQDDTIQVGIGNGGWINKVYIEDGMVVGFKISSKINISDLSKEYGAKITHSSEDSLPDIRVRKLSVKEAGYSDDFELATPVLASDGSAPCLGDLVSIGEYGKETISAICLGKKDSGNGRFELSLVPYSPSLYTIDSGAKVEFDSKVSNVQKSVVGGMTDYVGKAEMIESINGAVSGIVLEAYDKIPPSVPKILKADVTDVGNVQITFSPSTDDGSGVLQYTVWRRMHGSDRWQSVKGIFHDASAGSYFYEDQSCEKFKTYAYAVSAYDRMNNESEKSESVSVETDVTRKPPAPKAISANAEMDSIEIQYSHTGGVDASEQAAEWEYEISKDGGETWTVAMKNGSGYYSRYRYDFDRDNDGYPEADELDGWKFRARVKSPYGIFSDWAEISVNDSSYGTWLIPPVETSAAAGEHNVILQWKLEAIPYGTVRYDLYLGEELIAENIANAYYAYRFTDNLTKEEVGALEFSVRARNEAHERTEAFSVDASAYLGYKTAKPWIKATARKEGIDVSWDRTNDFYGKCEFVLLKDGVEIFRSASETEFFLPFGEDEFPEKDDIEKIALQVRIDGDADSATSDPAETDTTGYLTHVPSAPTAYTSASGRNANLSWDSQDGVYGFTGCDVQIAKAYKEADGKMVPITDDGGLEWYAPALGLNPYESLDNYKRGEAGGYLEVKGNSVSFSLPLFGQDGGGAEDTPYAFRLRGRSAVGKTSEWTDARFVTCRAISAYDVVKAWDLDDSGEKVKLPGALGVNQIFAEELSAISANLGYITDGALKGNAYNYWAVSDTKMDDGSVLRRGAFRVGGKEQYILVEPRLKDGAPTGEYDITFVVGNYSVSASGTQISGGAFEVYDKDGNLMFGADADGSKSAVETGRYLSTVPVIGTGSFESRAVSYSSTIFEDGGDAYTAEVYVDVNSSAPLHIRIQKIEIVDGEFKRTTRKLTFFSNQVPMHSSVLACAKPGRAVFVSLFETKIKFIEYDTASNKFTETLIAQRGDALFETLENAYKVVLTDYGIVYYTEKDGATDSDYVEYECWYVGADGRTVKILELGWWKDKGDYPYVWPLFRDEQDFLYVLFPVWLGVWMVRLDKATMTLGFASMLGILMQTLESAEATADPLLAHEFPSYRTHPRIADGRLEFIAMCSLMLTSDASEKRGFGARLVSVGLGGIAWGSEENPTPVRPTVYDWKPALQSSDQRILLSAGFSGGGDFVCPVHIGNWQDPATGEVTPPHLEEHRFRVDDSVPDMGYDMMDYREDALKNEKVCEIDSTSEDGHFDERVSTLAQCAVMQDGGRHVFASSFFPESAYSYDVRLAAFYAEEKGNTTERKPMMSGVGFFKVLYDRDTGNYRYYLDPATGVDAILEFDKDGRLLATKGDKGSPGDKGDKGDKGERGDAPLEEITGIAQKSAWPVGSIWTTKGSSLDPNALFGGTWKSSKVLIGFTNYYFWERVE